MTTLDNQLVAPNASGAAQPMRWLVAHLRRRTSEGAYRPEIDGVRFFAIAIVIVGHSLERDVRTAGTSISHDLSSTLIFIAQPGAGVLLFFTISGFVIANQFFKRPGNPLSGAFLSHYFRRRVLRIEPPYMLLLTATFALIMLSGFRPADSPRFAAAPHSLPLSFLFSLLYLHGLTFGSLPRLFPPGWSLEIEVQFYVLAPLLFYQFHVVKLRIVRSLIGLFILFGGTYVACFVPWSIHLPYVQRSIVLYLPYFWLGVLIADNQSQIRLWIDRRPILSTSSGWIGLSVFSATDLLVNPKDHLSGTIYMLGLLGGMALMMSAVLASSSSFRRFTSLPLISMIGGQCYSIYLTHVQTLQVATPLIVRVFGRAAVLPLVFALQVLAVLLVGTVFYAAIERPFMANDWPQKLLPLTKMFARRSETETL